jgi:type IV pilus assembly protein PilC
MKLYYKALADHGKAVHGVVVANSTSDAARYLRTHKLFPIVIREEKSFGLMGAFSHTKKLKFADLIFFTRQLSSMLASGLTLMQALTIFRNQVEKRTMYDMVSGIISEVEEGKSFSGALAKYPDTFSPIYVSLIKTAEGAGLLDKILLRLADNLEKQQKLRAQIKSALLYPVIVILMMIGVAFVMMIAVIPQLSSLYESMNIELPFATQVLVDMSNFSVKFWPLMIGGMVGLVYGFRAWYKTSSGKMIVDRSIIRLPIFGKLIRQSIFTEMSRTLSLLIGAGNLVVPSLQEIAGIVGNSLYEKAIVQVADRVTKGISVGDAMAASPLFPGLLVELVRIGEQTGKLEDSLQRASEYFERETEQTVKTLTTAMEPIIMLVLGIGVAFLLIAVITPIYKLTTSF